MKVYRRYFKVTEGALIDYVTSVHSCRVEAEQRYTDILNNLGAEGDYYVNSNKKLIAIIFKEDPDPKVFRRVSNTNNGWFPKKNCKKGKEIAKELEEVPIKNIEECLEKVGLPVGFYLFHGGVAYKAVIGYIPSDPVVVYISVPWYDEDPEVLEKYKEDHAKGIDYSSDLDALLWEPTPEMVEVKEWECKKAIQEWNDSLKEGKS